MISKQDVEKLSGLARLGLTPEEIEVFPSEIEAILGYVGKVNDAASSAPHVVFESVNTLREDAVLHNKGQYSEALLDSAPEREGGYVKVKKILE